MTLFIIVTALVIDWFVGEPKRWHPLVGFGQIVRSVEQFFFSKKVSHTAQIVRGGLAWLLLVLPFTAIAALLTTLPIVGTVISIVIVYVCLGHRSLYAHVEPIIAALHNHDDANARSLASQIVSRDKATLNVPKATIESVLENGNDAVFAALLWFIVAGLPGVIVYRLANTLDAMWGYKNHTYLYFGRIAARVDDVMNFIPARLTAVSYVLLGQSRLAIQCWQKQAHLCESPNAGPVMTAGAGALNVSLGGAASYGGQWHQRPNIGTLHQPQIEDIQRALALVSHSIFLWLIVIASATGAFYA